MAGSMFPPKVSQTNENPARKRNCAHICQGAIKIISVDLAIYKPLNCNPMFKLRLWSHWTSFSTSGLSALVPSRWILNTAVTFGVDKAVLSEDVIRW